MKRFWLSSLGSLASHFALLWILSALLPSNVSAVFIKKYFIDLPTASDVSAPSAYNRNEASFSTSNVGDSNYEFHWRVNDTRLYVWMKMRVDPASGKTIGVNSSWMGIAFGATMLKSQFIIAHLDATPTGVPFSNFHEHTSVLGGVYASPEKKQEVVDSWVIRPVSSTYNGKNWTAEFSRTLTPRDSLHIDLSTTGQTDMLFAFYPGYPISSTDFVYHGANTATYTSHGYLLASLDGSLRPVSVGIPDSTFRSAHGIIMMTLWLFWFPAGVVIARYLRSFPGWNIIHIIWQLAGIFAFIVAACLAIFTVDFGNPKKLVNMPHYYLGLTILGLVVIMVILGSIARSNLTTAERGYATALFIRLAHKGLGWLLVLAAFVQMYLGINALHPCWTQPDGCPAGREDGIYRWVLYVGFALLLVLGFIMAEITMAVVFKGGLAGYLFERSQYRKGLSRVSEDVGKANRKEKGDGSAALMAKHASQDLRSEKERGLQKREFLEAKLAKEEGLRSFTWQSLDDSVKQGKVYVVGNGKYVYDATSWISSHPGGTVILHSVSGTDITNDFFYSTFFDATEMQLPPSIYPSARRGNPRQNPLPAQGENFPPSEGELARTADLDPAAYPMVTPSDWSVLSRARRTHVHSNAAIRRLASLRVGELKVDSEAVRRAIGNRPLSSRPDAVHPFDPFEFRRYALTSTATLVPPQNKENNRLGGMVVRLRFCLLYPNDTRVNEPATFLPGDTMQIQIRQTGNRASSMFGVSDSGPKVVDFTTRYYTAISGCPIAFEIMVRVPEKGGAMANLLAKQVPGQRQYKIRGPFGINFLAIAGSVPRPVGSVHPPMWTTFVSRGSGLTPFLQLLHYLFLPEHARTRVLQAFTVTEREELPLQVGDLVVPRAQSMDGWCFAESVSSGATGYVPLSFLAPRFANSRGAGEHKLVLLHYTDSPETLCGLTELTGAALAYPGRVEYHIVFTKSTQSLDSILVERDRRRQRNLPNGDADLICGIGTEQNLSPTDRLKHQFFYLDCTHLYDRTSLDGGRVRSILMKWAASGRSSGFADSKVAVVCGPPAFQDLMIETLVNSCSYGMSDVHALAASASAYDDELLRVGQITTASPPQSPQSASDSDVASSVATFRPRPASHQPPARYTQPPEEPSRRPLSYQPQPTYLAPPSLAPPNMQMQQLPHPGVMGYAVVPVTSAPMQYGQQYPAPQVYLQPTPMQQYGSLPPVPTQQYAPLPPIPTASYLPVTNDPGLRTDLNLPGQPMQPKGTFRPPQRFSVPVANRGQPSGTN